MVELQKDVAQKQRIDSLVKELAARYRDQHGLLSSLTKKDEWTSRPMVLSFVDFQDKGSLIERDGLSLVLTSQLGDLLNQSGRVQVVERVIIDRLLEELNLGSSELADPQTSLRLGKVLAAKIVATGSLLHLSDSSLLNMRLVDTETTAVPKVISSKLAPGSADLENEIHELNRIILQTVVKKYPLHGYIVQVSGDQAMINIGSGQGVVPGTRFDVLEEGKPIKYKGRTLKGLPKKIAVLEVVQVEPDLCSVQVISSDRPLKKDDKISEQYREYSSTGKSNENEG